MLHIYFEDSIMQPATSNQQPATSNQQPATSNQNSIAVQSFLSNLDNTLWNAADKLRNNLDAANYKHIVLGFIFLKYVSDTFTAHQAKLLTQFQDPNDELYLDPEFFDESMQQSELNQREYYTKDNIFWVPEKARWETIKSLCNTNIGDELPWGSKFKGVALLIDDAFEAIEQENPKLKGVLQRIASFGVAENTLIGLVNTFSDTNFTTPTHNGEPIHLHAKDILGHVYEYFLGQFALAEGKKGGQYFTPKSIVTLIVEMLEPYQGRIYDPAMGSGGFFVSTDKFIQSHSGNRNAISIYGQESNPTTRKLAVMNMAIRGIDFDFGNRNEDTLKNPLHIDKKMDFIMANPPFNIKEWWSESLADDPRWKFGTPPESNANFAWLQHMIYHLSEKGKMALLLANGSMSSQTNNEGEIRKNIINSDLIDCMVALPGQLFTNTQIPACIWFLNKNKTRKGEVLFIDARNIGYMKDRVLRDFSDDDIQKIADTYHKWQQSTDYEDIAGFCKSTTLNDIADNNFVLTAGRYVGAEEIEDDGIPFAEKMQNLTACLRKQFAQGQELEQQIEQNLKSLGF
ncbi:type I restriction-modification system subunit M [Pasteurella atlantica]|nr:type I restriction-modification system subunit M [Pasteurella atlantica]MDP8056649.1 type I restriction-modification system subunit M [Pasteurella atlantica]MDP8060524.1 type I restriction-modification system subunit M [Pasteurella atlantica]MDP8121528.1 type I restriction-modification system subunit M [Pasteurella atlantica]MDP8153334.1 type I restriction-modification system subunit M [Pasteurella atlantica]